MWRTKSQLHFVMFEGSGQHGRGQFLKASCAHAVGMQVRSHASNCASLVSLKGPQRSTRTQFLRSFRTVQDTFSSGSQLLAVRHVINDGFPTPGELHRGMHNKLNRQTDVQVIGQPVFIRPSQPAAQRIQLDDVHSNQARLATCMPDWNMHAIT